MVETYLSRRWEPDKHVRLNTAIQIANRFKKKTGLESQSHQPVGDFLEEAARKLRDSGPFSLAEGDSEVTRESAPPPRLVVHKKLLVGARGFEPRTPCAQVLVARRINTLAKLGYV